MKSIVTGVAVASIAVVQGATMALASGPDPVVDEQTVVVAPAAGGFYLRGAVGLAKAIPEEGFWEPPGFPADPTVFFDIDQDNAGFGEVALGYNWNNGFRADLSFAGFGEADFDGPWSRTDPVTPGPHADVSGSIRTKALMANGYFEPLANRGGSSRFQPFVTAGIGMARNEMSDWTRTNPASARVTRTFEGDTETGLAWSLGFGVSAELNAGGMPMFLEASYRYFDLGTAKGSATPLPGNGAGRPVTPLEYENRAHVIAVGVRIPLGTR